MQHHAQAIEGVFFDLDGTLMDTVSDFVTAIQKMQVEDQRPPLPPKVIRDHFSAGSGKLVQLAYNLTPEHPEAKPLRHKLLDYYDRVIKQPERSNPAKLYPGISEVLDLLDQKGIPWGIVTNKPEPYALILIEQCQLLERVHSIVCPEHVSKAKPSPEALILACEQTRCPAESSLYLGDHIRDIEAGRAAGMFTIAAHYGYINEQDEPYSWQADHNIHSATELLPWLEQNHWQIPRS